MKTLRDHIILYDEECPMCNLYTKAFVQSGMLDQAGRACYQKMPESLACNVDKQRAVNEIALVNKKTGEVQYGIRSLFTIIGNALPLLKILFAFTPFLWFMSKVYAFVSYNRRVIIPPSSLDPVHIQPSFRLHYRISYLLCTWLATALVLSSYAHLLAGVVPVGNIFREYMICGGQIIWQGIITSLFFRKKTWDYLGNMMTISFAGALLLTPGLLLAKLFDLSPVFYTLYFLAVAALMLFEHIRRTQLLRLGWMLTCTWVAYRLLVLLSILFFT